jgi:hypothetical protein
MKLKPSSSELRAVRITTSGCFLMMHQLLMTKNKGPTFGCVSRAYIGLALHSQRSDSSRTATLDRYGSYEVRLIEFLQTDPTGDCFFWLELYCHDTKSSLDSCRCNNLDEAQTAADLFIASAKRLQRRATPDPNSTAIRGNPHCAGFVTHLMQLCCAFTRLLRVREGRAGPGDHGQMPRYFFTLDVPESKLSVTLTPDDSVSRGRAADRVHGPDAVGG